MTAQVQAVSFSLTGESLMQRARNVCLSGNWREAIEILTGSLIGMTTDQAMSVISGKCKLTGSSLDNVYLEPEDDGNNYVEDVEAKYGGAVRIDGRLYWPYAVITDYGREDQLPGSSDPQANPEFVSEGSHDSDLIDFDTIRERAYHYANDRTNDHVTICTAFSRSTPGIERKMAVIFGLAHDVPLWVKPEKNMQAAVDKRMDQLDYKGFCKRYGSEDLSHETDKTRMANQAKANLAASVQTFDNRQSRERLAENLSANANRSKAEFDDRRKAILAQNAARGFGLRRFDFGGKIGVRSVPEGPLINWALSRTLAKDKAPEWTAVSPQGVKMFGDDPVHTDWVTGAGLENEDFFSGDLITRQEELMHAIQMEMLGFDVNVLVAGRDQATGTVVYAKPGTPCDKTMIAVIANAGPDYLDVARNAAAVIALKGGSLSHLAVVGLEEGFLIVRDPLAKKKYPEGTVITVDAVAGEIRKVAAYEANDEESSSPKF